MQTARRENRFEEWSDIDFSGQSLGRLVAYGGAFLRCDFSETSFDAFSAGHEAQTRFADCVFRRTRFPLGNTHLGDVRFERCLFDGARLRDLRVDTAEFVDCVFRGRIWHTVFSGTPTGLGRSHNEWRGNDFSAADLVDVEFRDIDLGAQRWPADRDEYALIDRVDERVDAARAAADDWPAGALRALTFLRGSMQRDPHGRLLVRRRELGHTLPPRLRDQLWARLVTDYTDDQE